MKPDFLTVEDVLGIHAEQIATYGGESGLRDLGLLESAVAQPQATFGGEYLHHGLFPMAAAYLFHIAQNHPFLDGNKRAGLVAALVFLKINGIAIDRGTDLLYDLTIAVVNGSADKQAIAEEFERLALAGPSATNAADATDADSQQENR